VYQHEADDQLQMGAVILPIDDATSFKNTLYNNYRIEVVVDRWRDHTILRFSVHAHTTQQHLDALAQAVANELRLSSSSLP
jgi:hypothetical protein